MPSTTNEFTSLMMKCREILADINVMSHAADDLASLKNASLATMQAERINGITSVSLVSTRFLAEDIRPRYFGGHDFDNTRLGQLFDETNGRFQAECLCLAFEAVEGFLKRLGGEYFWQKRIDIGEAERERFAKAASALPAADSREYFTRFVEWTCRRNTDELIKRLRREIPEFGDVAKPYALTVKPYTSKVDLFRIFKLISECRHLIIHNHGRVDVLALAHRTGTCAQDIEGLCRKGVLDDEMTILPKRGQVTDYLEYLADFCYLCYKAVSNQCGLAIDFDPYEPGTTPTKGTPEVLQRLHGFGSFRDDPTLRQISEDAYKERHAGVLE
jgi:hypothetical protein